jgi:subtilisin
MKKPALTPTLSQRERGLLPALTPSLSQRERGLLRGVAAVAVSLIVAAGPVTQPAQAQSARADDLGFIVSLRDGVDADVVAREHANTYGFRVSHVYTSALVGYAGSMDDQVAERLRHDTRVEVVAPNLKISAPPTYHDQIYAEYPVDSIFTVNTQKAPTGIKRVGASTNGKTQTLLNNGAGVGVAVIDTGIDLNHPDLTPVTNGKNCLNNALTADDDNGHGSHVAGTIAARDNFKGVVGIAPGAKLIAVKSLDHNGDGTWASVICGVDWVTANKVAHGIKIANMSLGGTDSVSPSDANCNNAAGDILHKSVCNSVKAGITYVAAAGNFNIDAAGYVPAGFSEVITVSAWSDTDGATGAVGGTYTCTGSWGLQTDDTWATGTNWGTVVDIAAPGVGIKSAWKNGGYNTICGTSMSAPHVAGAAALLLKTNPGWTPAQVKSALLAADTALANTPKHSENLLNVSTF